MLHHLQDCSIADRHTCHLIMGDCGKNASHLGLHITCTQNQGIFGKALRRNSDLSIQQVQRTKLRPQAGSSCAHDVDILMSRDPNSGVIQVSVLNVFDPVCQAGAFSSKYIASDRSAGFFPYAS
mmetsp:Transcript_6407/g.19431  ORF Transcript_6407/g.19431 Transcript_6407/m.19431 type:complete len:124 (-) Transcript_6407:2271-2642(-)